MKKYIRIISVFLAFILLFSLFSCEQKREVTIIERNKDTSKDTTEYTEKSDETTETAKEPDDGETRLQFLCCGDNIGHEAVYNDAERRADSTSYEYNFLPMYDGIRDLLDSADIKFINQETITAGASFGYSGYPNFNTPQDMGRTIVDLGFDVVNIATNHMLDIKSAGLQSAINFWKTQNILMIGGYENEADYYTPRIYETNGIKIAFLSYTYGTNGMTLDGNTELVIPLIDENAIRTQVATAKQMADLVFVSMHWGVDSSLQITNEQLNYAQLLTELGVDVVIGHHSHTLQNMEWKTNTDGHKTLIIYSLGNLLNSMYYDTATTPNFCFLVGGIATFDIVISEDDGIYIENPYYHPTVCHYTTDPTGRLHAGNFQLYDLFEDYTEELVSQHAAQNQHSFTLEDLYNYVYNQVSEEFIYRK